MCWDPFPIMFLSGAINNNNNIFSNPDVRVELEGRVARYFAIDQQVSVATRASSKRSELGRGLA